MGLTIDPSSTWRAEIENLLTRQGATWGARQDVVGRAIFGTLQLVETVAESCEPQGPLALEVTFDEFNLDVHLRYQGDLLEFPERRPTNEEIRTTEGGMRRLAGFMLRRNADRVHAQAKNESATIHFHFDH